MPDTNPQGNPTRYPADPRKALRFFAKPQLQFILKIHKRFITKNPHIERCQDESRTQPLERPTKRLHPNRTGMRHNRHSPKIHNLLQPMGLLPNLPKPARLNLPNHLSNIPRLESKKTHTQKIDKSYQSRITPTLAPFHIDKGTAHYTPET
jgi:hypothetical protein